jgi:hypothetical protein
MRVEECRPHSACSPILPFPAVRPTVAIRPIEASGAGVCYVRNTSTPAVSGAQRAAVGRRGGFESATMPSVGRCCFLPRWVSPNRPANCPSKSPSLLSRTVPGRATRRD